VQPGSISSPRTFLDRLSYVRQLVFSKTKLEFRLLWNKIFQKDDEELGWLLNPYRQNGRTNATMMSSFSKNDPEASYQCDFDTVRDTFGRERVTIHSRGLAKKSDRRRKRRSATDETLGDKAIKYARYMGMGVYITSTSFPSPFFPVNDCAIYDEKLYYNNHNSYAMSKVW
jgi:hypothetical protein